MDNEDNKLWVPLDITCEHCGKPLEVARVWHSRIEIAGHYTFKYRHADNKKTQCVVYEVRKVKPYSSWGVTKLYEQAIATKVNEEYLNEVKDSNDKDD